MSCGLVSATGKFTAWCHALLFVSDWSLTSIYLGRKKSLVLWGPSRTGKTLWARSLGKHAYFGGLFCLDEPIDDALYAVFDDMQGGLGYWHAYKFWLGSQSNFYATDKYKGKVLVEWGRPCVYLANSDPRFDEKADIEWLEANCVFVHVEKDIYYEDDGCSSPPWDDSAINME